LPTIKFFAKIKELFYKSTYFPPYFTMKKIIIFIGPPGSGKGTQAKTIARTYNYAHISSGDLLRHYEQQNDIPAEDRAAIAAMHNGDLVPDWLVYKLAFKEILNHLERESGVVLDGAIRNLKQAEDFEEFFAQHRITHEVLAIEIFLTDEESFRRMTMRKICLSCGEIYPNKESKVIPEKCIKCSGELGVRADDKEEVIRHRIELQGNKANQSIREFYKDLGRLETIDGMKTIEEVSKEVDDIIKNS
jgi:adenylate kinase